MRKIAVTAATSLIDRARESRIRTIAVLGLLLVVFVAGHYAFDAGSFGIHAWTNAAWLLAALACSLQQLRLAWLLRGRDRRAWLLIAAGSLAWLAAECVWSYRETVLGEVTPFPSLADLGWLGCVPLYAAGLVQLGAKRNYEAIGIKQICYFTLIVATLYAVLGVSLYDSILVSGLDGASALVAIAYPVLHASLFLFGVVTLWLYAASPQRWVFGLLVAGLGIQAAAFARYGLALLDTDYEVGGMLDFWWLLGFAMLYLAGFAQAERVAARPGSAADAAPGAAREQRVARQTRLLEPFIPAACILLIAAVMAMSENGISRPETIFILLPAGIAITLSLGINEWRDRTAEAELRYRADSALRALQLSERRLASILEIAPEAIVASDDASRIKLFNSGAERIFGYKASEVIGLPVEMLIPERFRAGHSGHVREFAGSSRPSRLMSERRDIVARRKDGSEFPAEGSVFKLDLEEGQLFAVILRDITERRRHERELRFAKETAELANRAKSDFLANMSHELRTPLNAILGFSEMIESRRVDGERCVEYAHDIHESGKLLLALITDVLDLSKIEAGHAELHEAEVDLAQAIDACLRVVADRARLGNLTLLRRLPERLPRLRADERKLKQMIINLLSNAVKFTGPGGSVEISVRGPAGDGAGDGPGDAAGDGLAVIVRDNGIGMDPDQIPLALAPFGQIDQGLARRHEGTGLGLPLVAKLIELHGGSLTLESAPGKGTAAILRFPGERLLG